MAIALSTLVAPVSSTTRPYTTPTLSPAGSALVLVVVANTGSINDTSSKLPGDVTSTFGIVGSWALFQQADPGATAKTSAHVWWAITSASPGSGTATIATGSTPAASHVAVLQLTGIDTTAPIAGQAGLATTLAAGDVTLTAAPLATALTMLVTVSRNDSSGATAGTGMTMYLNAFGANPSAGLGVSTRTGSTATAVPYAGLNTVHNSLLAWSTPLAPAGGGTSGTAPKVTETDTAASLAATKAGTVARVTEASSTAASGAKAAPAPAAAETSTARPLTAAKAGSAPRASETSTARPLTATKTGSAPRASESASTGGFATKAGALPTATTVDVPGTLTGSQASSGALPPVGTSEAASGLSASRAGTLPRAGESSTASSTAGGKTATLARVTETGTARAVTGVATVTGALPRVATTESARPLAGSKRAPAVVETAGALSLAGTVAGDLPTVASTEQPMPLGASVSLTTLVELSQAQALAGLTEGLLPGVGEVEVARPWYVPAKAVMPAVRSLVSLSVPNVAVPVTTAARLEPLGRADTLLPATRRSTADTLTDAATLTAEREEQP